MRNKRILFCVFLAASLQGAVAKKGAMASPEASRKEIERQVERGNYEKALGCLNENRERLDPVYLTNTLLLLYEKREDFNPWHQLVESMPDTPDRDARWGIYWSKRLWTSRARECYERYFERGGAPELLRSNRFTLLTSEIALPGHWLAVGEFGNLRASEGRGASFSLPWGGHLYFYYSEAREYGESEGSIQSTLKYFRGRFTQDGRYALSDRCHTLVKGRLIGSLRSASVPPESKEAILVGVLGDQAALMRRKYIFHVVPGRGSEFSAYEWNRGGVLFELSWYYGGPEEERTLADMERFLDSVLTH